MRLLDDSGSELEADFDIEATEVGVDLIMHSRSGTRESKTNPDYFPALELILERMSKARPSISRVIVDSRPAQTFPVESRTIGLNYPIELTPTIDVHALRVSITEGQRLVASNVDPASRGGNKHKRIRVSFVLDAESHRDVERLLGVSVGSIRGGEPPGCSIARQHVLRRRD